ncbi:MULTISPECIES: FxLD family lanthipeptide [Streptomyces violaceoruber group]|jgi:FxLD family lantipeptide|uniref:FxLD family lantipeptide n=1 Tax=Streptomyces rubrogriseus TaxID=194673 RepID=A0A6G3TA24_9ACTN|nr:MULTISPECIES: FxLD family lanthipeptide [Streptomyces anthocyanicus group]NEC33567.1 FxLD family lantipeptide [Streptomyces rubrogriseus]
MTRSTVVPSSTQVSPQTTPSTPDGFDLDVSLVEVADPAGLVNLTDDNCGSTCGACTTNVA